MSENNTEMYGYPPPPEILRLQTSLCKIMSNPRRVLIIRLLEEGEKSVTELVERSGLRKAAISQNLAPMRELGLVKFRRDGQKIYYSLKAKKVIAACSAMQSLLSELSGDIG